MQITEDMIRDCVSDTRVGGSYHQLYEMIVNEIEKQHNLDKIVDTLEYDGVNTDGMSKMEILYEYSQLV